MRAAASRASGRLAAPGSAHGVEGLFGVAVARAGIVERCYVIGGRAVRMRFAGPAMLDRIGGSFAHLEVPGADEEGLGIDVWDSSSTGTPAPPVLGVALESDGTGPIFYYEDDGVRAISRWQTLSVLDTRIGRAWFWAPDPAELLSWDWASPLRSILHWWLGAHGILQVHGGAVGLPEGGVLVVGRGGSGKSTTTLSCLAAGLKYAGDDFVGIQSRPSPWVHSLYSSGKLESHHAERFRELLPAVVNPERGPLDKAIVYAGRRWPDRTTAGFPLRAVLVPRIAGGRETRLVPASPAGALAALAPSTIFQLHPPQENALSEMAALVRQVPCFSLELGSELERIPVAIEQLLREE